MVDRTIRDWDGGPPVEVTPESEINARLDRLSDAVLELVKLLSTSEGEMPVEPPPFWREFGKRLSSRKFLVTVAALIAIVGNWMAGTVNDQAAILGIVGALTAFIGGQAYQDAKTAGSK